MLIWFSKRLKKCIIIIKATHIKKTGLYL